MTPADRTAALLLALAPLVESDGITCEVAGRCVLAVQHPGCTARYMELSTLLLHESPCEYIRNCFAAAERGTP